MSRVMTKKLRPFLLPLTGLIGALVLWAALRTPSASPATTGEAPATKEFFPKEDKAMVLRNPDMGWVVYENIAIDPRPDGTGTASVLPAEGFPDCDYVAILFAWSDVETADGIFNWTRIDNAYNLWRYRGKGLHVRMSTEPLFGWSTLRTPAGLGVPDWLLRRLPDDAKQKRTDGPRFGWHVDARHPLYQEKLARFLAEARRHFTGDRQPALIDLRGFGRWGEWHTGFKYPDAAARRQALEAVLRTWSQAFPDQPLALSYSHDPDGPAELHAGDPRKPDPAATKNFDAYLRHSAFDFALTLPNVTLRRDGAGGAVSPNERRLSEEFYLTRAGLPQTSEFVGGYAKTKEGGQPHVEWTVNDALSLHPNYVGLLGYGGRDALDFTQEQPALVAQGLRTMGYRIVPTRVKTGPDFLEIDWVNRGVGKALRDYRLFYRQVSRFGQVMDAGEAGAVDCSLWLRDQPRTTRHALRLDPSLRLQLGLRDPASWRMIQMPLADRTADGYYPVGP